MSDDKNDDDKNLVDLDFSDKRPSRNNAKPKPAPSEPVNAKPKHVYKAVQDPSVQESRMFGVPRGQYPILDKISDYMGMGLASRLGWHSFLGLLAFIGTAYLLDIVALSYISGPLINYLAFGKVSATLLGIAWFLFVSYPIASRVLFHSVIFFRRR
ncbi:MAG: hypothetical protein ACI9TY_000058 [Alphaproteobacteria bacterium]|jgi:hypothetical protein